MLKLKIYADEYELGAAAAKTAGEIINRAIKERGKARVVLSTGMSQFTFFEALKKEAIDWSKVEAFHLDEYVGVLETHKASFRKYLKERFEDVFKPETMHYIDGTADIQKTLDYLEKEINRSPIDLGMIGIGENAHIAFNDPPADFDTLQAYRVVDLDETCKLQQIREGWFDSLESVCKQAISMTCSQIMKCKKIISAVPYLSKAQAIKATFENEVTNMIPATLLKNHSDCVVMCDKNSASSLSVEIVEKYSR